MINRRSSLQILRKERHPLAVLGMLAMVMRVIILVLGTSAAADPASAGIFVTCQNLALVSEDKGTVPASQPHQAEHCICGPACPHGVHPAALPLKAPAPLPAAIMSSAPRQVLAHRSPPTASDQSTDPIRGPPVSLT